ncbi:MAG: ABC-type multidrug transport system fused ATPase/permease subunit [Patescibacteria group bacterium]|jgi:ABC-type multidrug transport system fused ATPase/permease subunit
MFLCKMAKKAKNNFKKNIKEYFRIIAEYKWLFILLIVITALLETLTLIPKLIFKEIIDSGAEFTSKTITTAEFTDYMQILILIFILFTIGRIVLKICKHTVLIALDSRVILKVKKIFFNHIISLDHNFHATHKTGSIISKLNRGSGAMEGLTDTFAFSIAPLIIQIIITSISFTFFNMKTAIVLVITSTAFIVLTIFIQQKQRAAKEIFNDTEDLERGNMADFFTNIESIKYFGKDEKIKEKYADLSTKTKNKAISYWRWYRTMDGYQSLIVNIGTILIIYYPLIDFINGQGTIGTVSFIYTAYLGYLNALYGFTHGIRGFYRNMTDLESLLEYKKYTNSVKEKKNAKPISLSKGKVEFKNIDFTYPKGEHVFSKFNLTIPSGKKVALVGHSGSGKTTVVKLLYRLFDTQKGDIIIDGQNIKDIQQESLRGEMAIVSQEPVLFDDTIYNNIKFSKPDATEEEINNAIKFAQLDKVIAKLPKKKDTIVGERGIKLSGGQKQRVSIARALLANKRILVLDEATSALDSETEFEIQKDLEDLMKNRTTIIIAHRLSTIMNADIIVVMQDGKVIQKGNHRELITQGGEYKKLWDFQKGGFIQD